MRMVNTMDLYIIKEENYEGVTVHGVFDSEELVIEQIKVLLENKSPYSPEETEYYFEKVRLNELFFLN